ncbi:VTT domain-containing protein [Promicromonospora sp. NPDC050880]|uniref:VTT domain-containing protein n=1 Tax=unclassified Promicromonospora TaxID=2647929 RepID=UPI003796CCA3
MLLVSTFFYSAAAAVAAFLALEGYLAIAAADQTYPSTVLAAVAAVGQVAGKLLWYWAGAGTTRLPWLRRKLESPKVAATMSRWRDRTDGRPVYTGLVLLASAFAGVPPFMVMSVVAGVLRVRIWLFVSTGLIGRFLRFWLVLEAADYAWFLL